MSYPVQGKNVILTADVGDEYIPFACGQDVTINQNKDIISTVTPDSGTDRTYAYSGLRDTNITMTGVTFLRDQSTGKKFAFDLFGSPTLAIRIVYTDDDGYFRSVDCTVLVPSISIDGTAGQLSHWNTTLQVTGGLTYNAAEPTPVAGEMFSNDYDITPGQSFVIIAALIGKEIIIVARTGTQHDDVSPSTPIGRQFKFTSASGRFDFDANIPFEVGDTIHVEWK